MGDENQTGTVTMDEWEKFTNKRTAKACLAILELDVPRTKDIFNLIDLDGSKEVSIEEFVLGCMQLQGSANTVDVETLLRSNKRLMAKVNENSNRLKDHLLEEIS